MQKNTKYILTEIKIGVFFALYMLYPVIWFIIFLKTGGALGGILLLVGMVGGAIALFKMDMNKPPADDG